MVSVYRLWLDYTLSAVINLYSFLILFLIRFVLIFDSIE